MDEYGNKKNDTYVGYQMKQHAVEFRRSVLIVPIDDPIQGTFAQNSPRDPQTCPKHNKQISKQNIEDTRLVPKFGFVFQILVNSQE
mmetsp:Transcript_13656/g.28635  ORF Transcript_13656/g.28635 Transcript_13656/m.28635 type:complete len:86 (+) Transcript_13656:1035-1292(+)